MRYLVALFEVEFTVCKYKLIDATSKEFPPRDHFMTHARFCTLYNLYQARVPSSHEENSRVQKNRAMYESAESGCDQRQDNLSFLKIRNNMSDRG